MKKLMIVALMTALSFNTFADCKNAYEMKAVKRAKSNNTLLKAGSITSAAALTGVAVLATGGGVFLAAGTGGFFTMATAGIVLDQEPTKDNNYYKVLEAIKSAEKNQVSNDLMTKLNKKMSFDYYSDFEQAEIKKEVVNFINEMNTSKQICGVKENGKFNLLNFNQFSKLIIENIKKKK
jgi:hypothetical protein